MPQLTVYIDEKTLKKIEKSASSENVSISKWVKGRLTRSLESSWPVGYFDLFGALKNSDLKRPKQIPLSKNLKRENL